MGRFLKEMTPHAKRRSEEHTSELQSLRHLVCRLLLEKKKKNNKQADTSSSRYKTVLCSDCRVPQLVMTTWVHYGTAMRISLFFFFFNDTATTEIYPLSLHDALPI